MQATLGRHKRGQRDVSLRRTDHEGAGRLGACRQEVVEERAGLAGQRCVLVEMVVL